MYSFTSVLSVATDGELVQSIDITAGMYNRTVSAVGPYALQSDLAALVESLVFGELVRRLAATGQLDHSSAGYPLYPANRRGNNV